MSLPPSTTSQLRDDIDSGRTGAKVAASNPAAAPLGTDDEAAGTPPSGATVAAARAAELKDPAVTSQEAQRDRGALVYVVAVALFALAVIGAALSTL